MTFAGNYQGPLYAPHPDLKMNAKQLDQFKLNYAELIVDGMDMDTLITFAIESIEQNIKDWDEDDVKSEILDLSLIHISEPTRRTPISYAVFCLKKKKT